MLACFGAAWPFSIHKSWTARKTGGKSVFFLFVVLAGYAAGIANKIQNDPDPVMWMYALNAAMVSVDIGLYFRNRRLERA